MSRSTGEPRQHQAGRHEGGSCRGRPTSSPAAWPMRSSGSTSRSVRSSLASRSRALIRRTRTGWGFSPVFSSRPLHLRRAVEPLDPPVLLAAPLDGVGPPAVPQRHAQRYVERAAGTLEGRLDVQRRQVGVVREVHHQPAGHDHAQPVELDAAGSPGRRWTAWPRSGRRDTPRPACARRQPGLSSSAACLEVVRLKEQAFVPMNLS